MKNAKEKLMAKQAEQPHSDAKKRHTLGVLLDNLALSWSWKVWRGMVAGARTHDANLITFLGSWLAAPDPARREENIIYQLASSETVEGLALHHSGMGTYLSMSDFNEFLEPYRPLPMVSIEDGPEDIPGVHWDAYEGMHKVLVHLIEGHGCRRIVFLGGYKNNPSHQERYRAYVETLKAYGIPLDPRLVFEDGWSPEIAEEVLDRRKLQPKVDFDAVTSYNDAELLRVMAALQARGVRLPGDVALVGYDDNAESQLSNPPLTSLRPPNIEVSQMAAEVLLAILDGQPAPECTVLPTRLMIRQSCGCMSSTVIEAGAGAGEPAHGQASSPQEFLRLWQETDHQEAILQIAQAVGEKSTSPAETAFLSDGSTGAGAPAAPHSHTLEQVTALLDAFCADLATAVDPSAPKSSQFVHLLNASLMKAISDRKEVSHWQDAISLLQKHSLPFLAGQPQLLQVAQGLWQQARVLIGDANGRMIGAVKMEAEQYADALRQIGEALITTFNVDGLMDILAQQLPHLGILQCYLSLYENPQTPTGGARLIMAFNEQGRVALESGGRPFGARQLVPDGLLPTGRAWSLLVLPLSFQHQHFGFIVLETNREDGKIFATLRNQISSALQGARLVEQVERRALQLQTAAQVSSVISGILSPDELCRQMVDLVRQRFNLYYTGLFLIDQDGERTGQPNTWAVLHAGTGEAGQQMIKNGHKLEVGSHSMIGRCIAEKKARVAQNVGAEDMHFNNPVLPDTRSELALPLISRGEVLGAMTVQSTQEAAFSEEDVIVLQTMADQLANALSTAQLFDEVQKNAIELHKAKEAADSAKEQAEKARQEAETANRTLEAQMWQINGQSLLNERMRGEQDVATLGTNVIQQLCEYLHIESGTLYVKESNRLKLAGSYAPPDEVVTEFKIGQGLLGQAVLANKKIVRNHIPGNQQLVRSGLIRAALQHIVIAPMHYDRETVGVIELGAFSEFSEAQMNFLDKALESIAIAFMTAQARARVNELFAQTRRQAEELQAQEEELRATNEELEAQTESLRASEERLKQNQAALEAANADLEEKTHILQEQQAELDRQNQVLRDAQAELQRKAEELALASKYKSEFLANMSHELRTPLNSMLILAGMLAKNEDGNLNADQVESMQVIHSGGTDLLNLINEILDLAKVEAGKMEFHFAPMVWDELLDRMHAQFDPLAQRKGLDFVTAIAGDVPGSLVTDGQRLAQIVKNLLSNAFKFTEQGQVSLHIHRPAAGMDLSASGLTPETAVAVSVRDTGIGMTSEQQQVVFEAFQQADGSTSRQYGGTGLGLAITREMTQHLGGQVLLESEPGQGSTFTIYLPLGRASSEPSGQAVTAGARRTEHQEAPPPFPTVTPARSQPPAAAGQPPLLPDDRDGLQPGDKILLIVEDDPTFAKVVLDYAHKKGFKAVVAANGESALTLCRTHCPAAIVLDLKLPGISGWDVLDVLKDDPDLRHIPVHIMSAEDEDLSAYQRGAMGFLTKPISQQDIEGAFARIEGFINGKIRSLLLVEDDDAMRHSVRKLLEGADIAIREAASGQAALEALKTGHFDCMILDLTLPDVSGFELLGRMDKDETIPKCPVIVYTGRELTKEENRELLKYADSVIVKGAKSPERLLDETALFLHRVVADMSPEKQKTIRRLHDRDAILQDKQILIVDDDARNAFALSKLLADKGVKMHIAPNATKALEMLEKLMEIDLILTDIMMPGMDGYELIRALRQKDRFRQLPIIALTAKAMKGDREKCLDAGADDYLSKPINAERLFSLLRVWLSKT
ncbi:MAG: response regulator [Chloroflexota bacterium]